MIIRFRLRPLLLAAPAAALALSLGGCTSLDLGDNPQPDVSKAPAALTRPPDNLKDGSKE